MEVNFKANLLSKTCIRKQNTALQKFVPHEVSFLEINPLQKKDIKVLKRITKTWGNKTSFVEDIYNNAKSDFKKRTFILTEQADNFDIINDTQILGVGQLSKENTEQYCLEYLETKPSYQQKNKFREYKGIGTRFLHSLKKTFYNKIIRVNFLYDKNVIDFYMKNDFNFDNNVFGDLIWKAPKKKQNL